MLKRLVVEIDTEKIPKVNQPYIPEGVLGSFCERGEIATYIRQGNNDSAYGKGRFAITNFYVIDVTEEPCDDGN